MKLVDFNRTLHIILSTFLLYGEKAIGNSKIVYILGLQCDVLINVYIMNDYHTQGNHHIHQLT